MKRIREARPSLTFVLLHARQQAASFAGSQGVRFSVGEPASNKLDEVEVVRVINELLPLFSCGAQAQDVNRRAVAGVCKVRRGGGVEGPLA